jgi:hypothetical protein
MEVTGSVTPEIPSPESTAPEITAPEITAPALRTGVRPDREWARGRRVVVLFHSRDNRDAARAVVQGVRNVYGEAADVGTVNVVDLSMFPRLLRPMVNADLERAFAAEAANLPGTRDAESYIVIVPDHDGKLTRAWGVSDAATTVSAVVLDEGWRERARASGAGAGDAVLAALAALEVHATTGSATDARPASDESASVSSSGDGSSTERHQT